MFLISEKYARSLKCVSSWSIWPKYIIDIYISRVYALFLRENPLNRLILSFNWNQREWFRCHHIFVAVTWQRTIKICSNFANFFRNLRKLQFDIKSINSKISCLCSSCSINILAFLMLSRQCINSIQSFSTFVEF